MDNQALKAYKLNKEKARKVSTVEKDVEFLKSEMAEIKELLMKALTNGNR